MQARGIGEGRGAGDLAAIALEIESELHRESIRCLHGANEVTPNTRTNCPCPGPGSTVAVYRCAGAARHHDLIAAARGIVAAGYGSCNTDRQIGPGECAGERETGEGAAYRPRCSASARYAQGSREAVASLGQGPCS